MSFRSPQPPAPPPKPQATAAAAFTLVEILVSTVIVGIGVGSAILCLASANRLAEGNRNMNDGVALCQERVAQVVGAPFSPPTTIPSYFGTWPVPANDTPTSTETVQLYTDVNGGVTIPGTRTTLVSLQDAALNLVRVTARVSYTYRGTSYTCETYTLRAPD